MTKVWVTLVGAVTENGDEVVYYEIDGGGSLGAAPARVWPLHAPDLVLVEFYPYLQDYEAFVESGSVSGAFSRIRRALEAAAPAGGRRVEVKER